MGSFITCTLHQILLLGWSSLGGLVWTSISKFHVNPLTYLHFFYTYRKKQLVVLYKP
jgi:hypothetical protein